MKKYMKPMMESENFVVNEFIGSCWTVTCDYCGTVEKGYDQLYNQIITTEYDGQESHIIRGELNDKEPCITETTVNNYKPWWYDSLGVFTHIIYEAFFKDYYKETVVTGAYHPVTFEEGHGNHPNASV